VANLVNLPVPLALLDLPELRVRAANASLLELAGTTAEELLGWSALEFTPPERRETVRVDQQAFVQGRLEGFQAGRTFHLPDGHTVRATVWARRLVIDGQPWALAIVLPADDGARAYPGFSGADVDVMMAFTDHDWVIEHVSADARRVMGAHAEELVGQPLLGAIHPDASATFAQTVAAATLSRSTMACQLRARARGQEWRDFTCYVSSLCPHAPPRLGLALSRPNAHDGPTARQRGHALEQVLWRIAMEVRSATLIGEEPTAITRSPVPLAAELSGRQWEIVQRLAQGQDAAAIASAMYLSPSTVRNHLVAVYRKLGVHSQVQLLARLRDELPAGTVAREALDGTPA
jgi:PAS domain S-box-containing protein